MDDAQRAKAIRRVISSLSGDPRCERSRREWRWLVKTCRKACENSPRDPFAPTEYDLLGGNRAPFLLEEDLDDCPALADRAWTSSRPDLLDALGHVSRPAGDVPVRVSLASDRLRDGSPAPPVRFEFRVMPERPRLPVLELFVNLAPTKSDGVDFSARFQAAGSRDIRRLRGFGEDGRLRHRGNTSYLRSPKKPISLKFDAPHHILGPDSARHLHLYGGYSDDSRLRNWYSFETWRRFASVPSATSAPSPHLSPQIGWIEVFVNGSYYGVFEMGSRVRAEMFAPSADTSAVDADAAPDARDVPVLFKVKGGSRTLYSEPVIYPFFQKEPNLSEFNGASLLRDFLVFTSSSSPDEFRARLPEFLDMDSLVDFTLLVNYSGNADGVKANHFLAAFRDGAAPSAPFRPFFFIPWDYDKTFRDDSVHGWISNHVIQRAMTEIPGFRDRLAIRWGKLRAGPLSEPAVQEFVAAKGDFLAPYLPFEAELLGRDPEEFAAATASVISNAVSRLHLLDERFYGHPLPPDFHGVSAP